MPKVPGSVSALSSHPASGESVSLSSVDMARIKALVPVLFPKVASLEPRDLDINDTSAGDDLLMKYATLGDLSAVKELFAKGVEVGAIDYSGFSALEYAAACGHHHIVQALLDAGADPSMAGISANILAKVLSDQVDDVLGPLLNMRATLKEREERRKSEEAAAKQKAARMINDEDRGFSDDDDAYGSDEYDEYDEYDDEYDEDDDDAVDAFGHGFDDMPDEELYDLSRENMVKHMFQRFGPKYSLSRAKCISPVLWAIGVKEADLLRLFLLAGANVHVCDESGRPPLCLLPSLYQYGADMVPLLLAAGADIHARTKSGETALHVATREGCDWLVKMLLAAGADVNAPANNGYTALHLACERRCPKIAQLLLAAGASITVMGKDGCTPLHVASRSRATETTQLLLSAGAAAHAEDAGGRIAL